MDTQKISLWRPHGRKGPTVPKKEYNRIANEIVSEIKSNKDCEIDLGHLIDQIRTTLSQGFNGDIAWYFLNVKQDLEERGIIKTTINRDRVQIIRLNTKVSRQNSKV